MEFYVRDRVHVSRDIISILLRYKRGVIKIDDRVSK